MTAAQGGTRTAVEAAVEEALRAPSVHNTQPWRWRIGPDTVALYADRSRHLAATDPDGRDLLLSCGCALHHLTVTLAARGLGAEVARFPDPEDSTHLATVRVTAGPPDPELPAWRPALLRRRTDRRRFAAGALTGGEVDALVARVHVPGVVVLPVTGAALRRLATAFADAAQRQRRTPGYGAELQRWTHRGTGGHDGVGPAAIPHQAPVTAVATPLRDFGPGSLPPSPETPGLGAADDGSVALVVATGTDTPLDALRAGEAADAILLAATAAGWSSTPLSQGLEVPACRRAVQVDVLGVPEHPQLVVRVGRPAPGAAALPATPRRPLRAVLLPD